MTINYSNVEISNNFDTWLERTNQLLTEMRTRVVTANSNTTVGNVSVTGTTTSTVVVANTITANTSLTTVTVNTANLVASRNVSANNFSGNTVTVNSATASVGNIATITSDAATITNITSTTANITNITASNLVVDTITSNSGVFASTLNTDALTATNATVVNLTGVQGIITTLFANNISAVSTVSTNIVSSNTVTTKNVTANVANINSLTSGNVTATTLISNTATITNSTLTNVVNQKLTGNVVTGVTASFTANVSTNVITATNVVATRVSATTGTITNLTTNVVAATNVNATNITGNIAGASANFTALTANTITVNVLTVTGGYAVTNPISTTGNTISVSGAGPHVLYTSTTNTTNQYRSIYNGNNFEMQYGNTTAGFSTLLALSPTNILYANTHQVWHANNDGAGSTLDADLLDGYHGSWYQNLANSTGTLPNARISGAYDGITTLGITSTLTITNAAPLIVYKDSTANAYASRTRVDTNNFYIDGAADGVTFAEVMRVELDTSTAYIGSQKVWTAGNDGAASTLDADLLDGQHGAYYLNASNLNTGTLPDARISGAYTGITTLNTTGTITVRSTASTGSAALLSGNTTSPGYTAFYNEAGLRAGYVGSETGTNLRLGAENGYTGWNCQGTFTATGDITAFSDARLKSDVETITDALGMVNNMRGVRFTKDGKRGIGVIAQEMRVIAPELVQENEEMLSVAYGNTVGILIEAIKELTREIEELKSKLEAN